MYYIIGSSVHSSWAGILSMPWNSILATNLPDQVNPLPHLTEVLGSVWHKGPLRFKGRSPPDCPALPGGPFSLSPASGPALHVGVPLAESCILCSVLLTLPQAVLDQNFKYHLQADDSQTTAPTELLVRSQRYPGQCPAHCRYSILVK